MTILFAIILGLGLLYFWLCGHWFARIVAFVPLSILIGFIFWIPLAGIVIDDRPKAPILGFVAAIIGIVAGWFASGLPRHFQRQRIQPPYHGPVQG